MERVVDSSGTNRWYLNSKLHRVNGPAVICPFGTKAWYLDGKHHRLDGPAIEDSDGTKMWCLHGKLHRVDKPAIEYPSGRKEWYINGKLHRLDGPAIEFSGGTKRWYLDDKQISEFDYYPLLNIRRFRSKITRSNNTLEFNFTHMLNLSRNKAVVEWYYSPDNGGGKLAKKRIEYVISI